ncbi:unnamed protein product [Rhizophagus irregularis]|nr:unnamed protein product [Rhizophagus irregularis]
MANNSFDPTPRLKSCPVPILFIPFNKDENTCNYCGDEYSETLKFQKYCKNCFTSYIKNITNITDNNNNTHLDVHINTKNACKKHKKTRNKFHTVNIKEWCEHCSEISWFVQVPSNDILFNYRYNSLKFLSSINYNFNAFFCEYPGYNLTSGWVKSTLTKKSIPIPYLPWWDNYNACIACYRYLEFGYDDYKWCSHCFIIHTGCRYCLTTNVIFGITDKSQCRKCKRILLINIDITNIINSNPIIEEFILSTRIKIDSSKIASYVNNSHYYLDVYKFIIDNVHTFKGAKWVPYSQKF